MVTQDQQDFDEFDNLVEENDAADDAYGDVVAEKKPKKKISGLLIIALFAVLGVAGGAVWFLFLNPQNTAAIPTAATEMPAPQEQADANLPPGVSPTEPVAPPQEVTPPIPTETPAPTDTPVADAGAIVAPPADALPAPTDTPVEGTTAEALPPPADMPVADAASPLAPVDAASTDQTAALPAADAPVVEAAAPAADQTISAQLPTPTVDNTIAPVPTEQKTIETAPTESVADPVVAEEAPAPVATPVTETPVAEAPAASVAEDVTATIDAASADRLNKVEQQLQTLTTELTAVKASPAAAASVSADPELGNKLQALTDKLDQLAQQVEALDDRTTTLATELQNRPASAPEAAAAPSLRATDPVVDEMPVIKPVEKKKEAPKPVAKKPAVKKPAATNSGWELRGASPGVAWLGRVGSGEMSLYAVGQSLPGLGTIQSISQVGGKWVVKGSNGSVSE